MKITIEVSSIELAALRKLELVSKVLATKLPGRSRQEQEALARVLSDIIDRIDIEATRSDDPDVRAAAVVSRGAFE